MHNYLTVGEIAQRLERQQETVANWLAEGRLPVMRLVGGDVVVPVIAIGPIGK
jgi:excisionase family DNA binding protein